MNIGWPEGIYIGLTLFSLFVIAHMHGKKRPDYNFPASLIGAIIGFGLVYWCGFFD